MENQSAARGRFGDGFRANRGRLARFRSSNLSIFTALFLKITLGLMGASTEMVERQNSGLRRGGTETELIRSDREKTGMIRVPPNKKVRGCPAAGVQVCSDRNLI